MMSGSSAASSDNSMTGRPRPEEQLIRAVDAGQIAEQYAGPNVGESETLTRLPVRPVSGKAVQTPTSSIENIRIGETSAGSMLDIMATSSDNSPMLGSLQANSTNHSHSQDRKRRVTNNGNTSSLQRTRSGGAIQREANVQVALPHRSVSMVVPTSRTAAPKMSGSSYEAAIETSSSPHNHPIDHRLSADHGVPRNVPLSSGISSLSHQPRRADDRTRRQTWHSPSEAGADTVTYPKENQVSRPFPWEPWTGPSSQASTGSPSEGELCQPQARASIYSQHTDHTQASQHRRERNVGNDFERGPRRRSHVGHIALSSRPSVSRSLDHSGTSWNGTHEGENRLQRSVSSRTSVGNSEGASFERTARWGREGGIVDRNMHARRVSFGSHRNDPQSGAGEDEGGYGGYPEYQDVDMPRWQPDAEVTSCPICGTVFSFWYRKHHCRKCGRVVCASCSPHRITIPRQYIVRPPESLTSLPTSSPIPVSLTPVIDLPGDGPVSFNSIINPALGGGEEVRLCNPCVPDPNPNPLGYGSPRAQGHRSTQSLSSTMGSAYSTTARVHASSRQERRTVGANDRPSFLPEFGQQAHRSAHDAMANFDYNEQDQSHMVHAAAFADTFARVDSFRSSIPSASRSAVCERDLCPVCGRRFPALSDDQPMEAREEHVRRCIASYGASPSQREPQHADARLPPPPVAARMLEFKATEKDCLGEDGCVAECTICMEDYEVGQSLARLECLCRFHKACIVDWFERKMECPVHKVS
ncbi:uncharacterized protein N7482_001523 [Penicillium canariense]|uniref:RING-type E3 ubiquitin transferase n=1 Tax=Penicillium canariense TaxID=189055 RepID=A0A9W9IJW0_9EURO|nr:uncharacterized protein N7482_001523 [Penicillium canariense]KAJ5175646.1 hypothetical protein N7482_001523 [Penicillium canariense]